MSTENGKHYKKNVITQEMVGQPLDPALIEKINPMDFMLSTALKKIIFAGKRGKKDKKQDLLDAIGAIQRQIELDDIDNLNELPRELIDYINGLKFDSIKDVASFVNSDNFKPKVEEIVKGESKAKPTHYLGTKKSHLCNGCIADDENNCSASMENATGIDCTKENIIFTLKEIKE